MSQIDRTLPKCGKPVVNKEGDGSDLSLSGSQVSLVLRPRSVTGKASIRALSVSGPRVKRPMSAVPIISLSEMTRDKRRPYSADSQLLSSSCQQNRSKHSAGFAMSREPIGLSPDFETDGDIEFSSSTLVSSNMSDQLGIAWMELEMKGLYLRNSDPAQHSCSTDDNSDLLCSSDVSEEPTKSEKSLGQCIQAMARDHIQHDGLQFRQPIFSYSKQKMEMESKLEKNNADPKKMSTKELHLQMVESGLIPSSLSYTSSCGQESPIGQAPQSRTQHQSQQDLSQEFVIAQTNEMQKRTTNEFHLSDGAPKEDTGSEMFWNQHDDVYNPVDKPMSCIDQISFPKEHDIDSLEDDSCYVSNNLESQRRQVETSNSSQVHSVQVSNNVINRNKCDWMPVRFQQWVMDSNNRDNSISNVGSIAADYFSGMHPSYTQAISTKTNLDCTVEEVLTDSEFSKTSLNNEGKTVSSEKIPAPSCSVTNLSPLDEKLSKKKDRIGEQIKIKDHASAIPVPLYQIKVDEASEPLERQDSVAPISSPKILSSDGPSKKSIQENALDNAKFSVFEGHFISDRKSSTISKNDVSSNRLKTQSIVHVMKRSQDQHLQGKSKRKTDVKLDASYRKSGKEESLPGESQPELLSWMAKCSENFGDSNTTVDEPTLERSHHSANSEKEKDSPYNDIMTILRVLEEKEDESSLMRILNKKCQSRTPPDCFNPASAPNGNTAPSESSTNSIQNNGVPYMPTSPYTLKISNSHERECIPNESSEKQKAQSSISQSTEAPCSNDFPVPLPTVQGELRDILTFLDAVDQSCSSVLQPKISSNPRPSPVPHCSSEDSQGLEELLSMGRSELAQEIVSLRLALEDKDATINLLRTALREQKDNQAKQNAAHTTELECHMRQVKSESEAIIKRHQKFIDQLISDKASLSERCESLIQDVKKCEEKHVKELCNLEAKHKVEMQRVKDITTATEKLKRERWVENKTQKIKELTVRGLEPELTRLTAQHEQEMSALRMLHAQELEQMEVRAARRASQQMEAVREQLVQEKEDALTREREMVRQRMEKQQMLYEEEGAEQRRRLVSEVRREQDRLATLEARLEAQLEERKRGLEREAEQERERMRRDYADKLTEMHRKQQNEILQLREAFKAEKETWMETYQQQQKQALTQTTNEVREQLKRERDREIEVVIERLENEATISREEREKVSENRLKRVREQLTSELRDVESALASLKDKYTDLRSQLQEKEDKLVSSEAFNRSLQTQLVETRKIADQLSAERADIKQALRFELNNEMESLRQQVSEQHLRHQQQQKTLLEQVELEKQKHQQELQQLYNRVKLAIAKKEEVVKVARSKQKAAEEQNLHLQALLDHRRKESLLS